MPARGLPQRQALEREPTGRREVEAWLELEVSVSAVRSYESSLLKTRDPLPQGSLLSIRPRPFTDAQTSPAVWPCLASLVGDSPVVIASPSACPIAADRERPFMAGTSSSKAHHQADFRSVLLATWPPGRRSTNRRPCASASFDQISVCSEISSASSTSMPRYRTVDSSFEWPSRSWTARRFFVRR